MKHTTHLLQAGNTLIEMLLYVAILGSLLISVSLYFAVTADARLKNQSIVEVEQQGALLMEQMVATVRTGERIVSPRAGATGSSLVVEVPASSANPTLFGLDSGLSQMGYESVGGATDSSDSNFVNATKFVAPASGTVSTLYARVGSTVSASPNNKAQMALYSGTNNPATRLATSTDTVITANSWNAFSIPATTVTSGTTYWLAYNTNGSSSSSNNLVYSTGTSGQARYVSQTYGTWPASYTGTSQNIQFSMYATIDVAITAGGMIMRESNGSTVALTNGKVEITALSFKNLSRSGTPGVVRISFTLSRVNPANKNEYDYQKTFTNSVAVRHL